MGNPDWGTAENARAGNAFVSGRLNVLGVGLMAWAFTLLGGILFVSEGVQLIFVVAATAVAAVAVMLWRRRRRMRAFVASVDPSVPTLWNAYLQKSGGASSTPVPPVWYFCDNEHDANECARLVLAGQKRATTPSRWFFESRFLQLPAVGDLEIITDWDGVAQCIIRTTAVDIVRFCDVTAEYAQLEGEGDRSLASWKAVHWGYYRRELRGTDFTPQEDMPLVCQRFEVVFP